MSVRQTGRKIACAMVEVRGLWAYLVISGMLIENALPPEAPAVIA